MKRFRFVLAVVAGIIAISLTPLTGVAATTKGYKDSVGGVEVYATSTEGRFTGQASGKLPGLWYADVIHAPLSSTPPWIISGGAFDLSTSLDNQPTLVTGQFSGGTVKQTGGFSDCTNQTYAVDGTLSNVGVYGRPDHGKGTFMATLTHYRVSIHGYCLIYAASIAGWVTLNF